jgi:hypothetical protein
MNVMSILVRLKPDTTYVSIRDLRAFVVPTRYMPLY